MSGGVPVLRQDDVIEAGGERVETRNDLVAPCYGEGASGEEVVLHIDDKKNIRGARKHDD